MAGIQVGGIVSGLDTNALVEQMTQQANIAVDRLNGQYSYKSIEKSVYTDINDMMGDISTDLLSLKLESTFLSKKVSSTNTSVASATATTDADIGSHSIKVSKLAKNSEAISSYTRVAMVSAGANVSKITGTATESLEGTHTVTVSTVSSKYLSTDVLEVNNIGSVTKQAGTTFSGVDSNGLLTADVTGDIKFSYTDADGNSQTLTISGTFGSSGQDINVVSTNVEDTLNNALNASMGTNNVQYVVMRSDYNSTSSSWNFSMYETTIDDFNIAFDGTDASTIRDTLGFSESSSPTVSTTTKINKYHLSDSAANLGNKLASSISGIVPGASLELSGALTTGTFVFAQDASLKVSAATYSTYVSDTVTTGTLDTATDGLQNAGFSVAASSSLNGTFTINGVAITIDDYTKISVDDLLGIINSSGAGVTASYDSTAKKFKLESNTIGAKSITLGDYSDTSSMFKLLKLDSTSETTYTIGSTSGSISTTTNLTGAGLTTYPYSGTFTVNGVSIYVDTAVDTIQTVIDKVNKSGAGVTMSYDATTDKIKLKSNTIDPITVGSSADTSNLLVAFNLTDDSTVEKTVGEEGSRAVFTVDGTTYVRDTNVIDDVVGGITFTLNSVSNESATIDVSVDPAKGVAAFAKLIQHYNTLMEKLYTPEVDEDEEEKYIEYLTDSDKESMSEDDIATYQENYELYNSYKIIRRSSELRNLDTNLRKSFFAERTGITSSINDMSDLGIKVAGAGDTSKEVYGYLVSLSTDYDEIYAALEGNETFMDALQNNPKDVYTFFANSSDLDVDDATTTKEKAAIEQQIENEVGWARYFGDYVLTAYTDSDGMIGNKLGTSGTLQTYMDKLATKISDQEDRVQQELERYWAQFTAMEQAISDAQSQASALSSVTGSSS
ncbi:flagellar filament capping protein FliD [Seleniivibrio woodruffii]|uniref:flagellar filament capping protein FliD n=1 Tax=Seleniivibrio woodruffii TaxID=1078050 RepID=UPI0026EC93FE|nr:flagellar filament capping protein FliD [Seleniivibrio woodruffii]